MLTEKQIRELLEILNERLKALGEIGEVGLVGGAVMCLVFNARESTKDIDAIFEPTSIIREIIKDIAVEKCLPLNWMNDAAKGYIQSGFQRQNIMELSHLRVWCPDPTYMLAMKCISARWDTNDRDDVIFLINHLKLKKPSEVFSIIESYYPKKQIPPKTQFLIEELLEG